MTRQYRIQRTAGRPDWNKIERALIDRRLWKPCGQISAYAQLAFDDSRLYVHLHAEEQKICAEHSGVLDQPCQDSCLEFFISAAALNAACARTAGGWDVTYELPFRLLRLFFPEFVPSGTIRGNFYKCGDLTEQEHYLAWNPVDADHPDFHRPEFFGELLFSD